MIQQKWLQLQMKAALDDYLKIAAWWRRNETFNGERFKSIKEDFSNWENEYIFGWWVGFFPIARASHKGSGERGTVHTCWVKQFYDVFVKKGDTWHMILGENAAGHCFLLSDLVLTKLFQISHSCNWMHTAGKIFFKTCLKVNRDIYLFSQYVGFPLCETFIQQKIFISPWGKSWRWLVCLL